MPSSMNPVAKLRQMQHDELTAALRAGKSGVRLLDDAENNIGNATLINPQVLHTGQYYTAIPQSPSTNSRVLNLTASSKNGQSITVVITASRVAGTVGFAGPLTGIVEFGNGTTTTLVEFDVPSGPFIGDLAQDQPNDQPHDSGAIIQVPTGVLRAYVRYDNAFLTPTLNGTVFGVGEPTYLPIPNPLAIPIAPNLTEAAPLAVKAFSAYFGRIHSKLYKTQYLYCTTGPTTKTSFFYNAFGNPAPIYCIPPFAKSVRLIRNPQTAAMTLTLHDGLPGPPTPTHDLFTETYAIPSGIAPIIPVDGQKTLVSVSSASGGVADEVYAVMLVYEIGF